MVNVASYFADDRHAWLEEGAALSHHLNIGADGRNLTIVFLSLNRSSLSIRLLRSLVEHVPHFRGEVLIADNGSDPAEVQAVEDFCRDNLPFSWRVLRFGHNWGVAGGRNRAFAEVRTDWILSLDNDIYLLGDPFPALQRDLARLGCHFLSVPLVNPDHATFYSFGGHLQCLIQNGQPRLAISTILPPSTPVSEAAKATEAGDAFLCTFLFGGASVLRRDSFLGQGRFDDAMLVGFEDIDFSLRLWRAGMKVGSSTIACFVHDHPPATAASDKDYERARYSRRILYDSARHLEAKHGYRIWGDEVEDWLQNREKEQAILSRNVLSFDGANASTTSGGNRLAKKPRIALVTDTQDWAFANISRQIMRHLGDRYDFDLIPMTRMAEIEEARWLEQGRTGFFVEGGGAGLGHLLLLSKDYDLIHVFWREYLTLIGSGWLRRYAERLGLDYETFESRFIRPACITTSVYDHLHCTPDALAERRPVFNDLTVGYTVASNKLDQLYRSADQLRPPAMVIEDGVDPDLFFPIGLERLSTIPEGREVVVGWVGNSKWASSLGDKKGVHTILIPAVEQLRAEGLPIRLELADRQGGFIPHDRMVHYYARIDVYVCTSDIEGTPNPVLEAMACGVPVVSTDVGIVPQVFGPQQSEFVLADRSVECLKAALRRLVANPDLFTHLSRENLERIEGWAWRLKTEKFDRFFRSVLEQRATRRGEQRTKMCLLPFTTPSMEVDGSIRLCSASSIFAYRDETNMGNCREEGLQKVWRGEKYRHIRKTLLSGENLTPYCGACEYRFDGPAWMLQLHLALHAWHAGVRDDQVAALLHRRADRYAEYRERAEAVGMPVLDLPTPLPPWPVGKADDSADMPEVLIDGGPLPVYLDLNTLNRCNVSCVMCPPAVKYDSLGQSRDKYYRLTTEEFLRLADGVNVKSAHFVGAYAEPLLNKDIFNLIAEAHRRGIFTAITSNAMALSRAFAERLVDAGLDMISISLHGAQKSVAEAIMHKSNFERVVGNIRGLQALKAEKGVAHPEIYFNYVAQRANVGDIADFVKLAHDLRVKHVNVIHLIDGDEAVDNNDNLIHYPELLVPQLREALRLGEQFGINVNISPAYREVLDAAIPVAAE